METNARAERRSRGAAGAAAAIALGNLLVMAACAVTPARSPGTIEENCSSAGKALFARQACFGVTPAPNEAALIARYSQSCVLASEAEGSRLDAGYWKACAAGANNGCRAFQCNTYPAGTRAVGAPCLASVQCTTLFCGGVSVSGPSGEPLPGALQCGTCAARLSEGAPCDAALDACAFGLSCFGGVCRRLGQLGASCATWDDCARPGVCWGDGTCKAPANVGDPCLTSVDCTDYVVCDRGTGRCIPAMYGEPGAACDRDFRTCWVGRCSIAAGSTTGVCPRVVSDGMACDPADSSQVCDAFAFCLGGVCQIPDPGTCG